MTVLIGSAAHRAAQALADLDPDVWCMNAGMFTCSEAETMLEFLLTWCGGAVADQFMIAHAHADETGDQHIVDETNTCGWTYREDEEDE